MNAKTFFARLRTQPRRALALLGPGGLLTYSSLLDSVETLAGELQTQQVRRLATLLPNGPAWVIADLAALRAGIVHVPLPPFFAASQIEYALAAAGVDALLAERPPAGRSAQAQCVAGQSLHLARLDAAPTRIPAGTQKITFTSGSTGTPKGVCLDGEAQLTVAAALAQALAPLAIRRHLCSLPLAVLLENVAGVYAPLLTGATIVIPSAAETGLDGASTFRPEALDAAVDRHGADSVITLPQMLRAWSAWRQQRVAAPLSTLKFVAVGGAQVGKTLIAQARRAGLPAFEGYGLSEGASVQTLNLPYADRPGSTGKPLPHAQIRIADDAEVWVAGSLMLGYVGGPQRAAGQWHATGDLGSLDADGFLHLRGRKSNVLITAFGRNVSPEWVETTLQTHDAIAHAVVYGEAQPALSAVLWPTDPTCSDAALDAAVAAANVALPDYARIARWVRAARRFDAANGMATANGRPRRDAIAAVHAAALNTVFNATNPTTHAIH